MSTEKGIQSFAAVRCGERLDPRAIARNCISLSRTDDVECGGYIKPKDATTVWLGCTACSGDVSTLLIRLQRNARDNESAVDFTFVPERWKVLQEKVRRGDDSVFQLLRTGGAMLEPLAFDGRKLSTRNRRLTVGVDAAGVTHSFLVDGLTYRLLGVESLADSAPDYERATELLDIMSGRHTPNTLAESEGVVQLQRLELAWQRICVANQLPGLALEG